MAENLETNHGQSMEDPFNTDHKQETTTKTTLHESVMSDACIEVKHPAVAELKQPAIPSFEELPEPSTLDSEIDHRTTDIIDVIAMPVTKIDDTVIEKLTSAVVANFLIDQRKVKKLLTDVAESQRVIVETLQQENAKYAECQILREVTHVMERAKIYHVKLINIKKDMLSLHDKSAELKKRALHIQQEKQKEALHREQKRDAELERDRKLTAKLAKRT